VKDSLSPSLLSFMCCAVTHRASLAPEPRLRCLVELRSCPPERRTSSSLPPNSAIAPSPPSIFSVVAPLQGKKAAAPSISSSLWNLLHRHGTQWPSGAPPAMVAFLLAKPHPRGHGRACFRYGVMLSCSVSQTVTRSVFSLVAATRQRDRSTPFRCWSPG
jgi:hypothetical protein